MPMSTDPNLHWLMFELDRSLRLERPSELETRRAVEAAHRRRRRVRRIAPSRWPWLVSLGRRRDGVSPLRGPGLET
jgi:hypothetical protein